MDYITLSKENLSQSGLQKQIWLYDSYKKRDTYKIRISLKEMD